MTRYIAINEPAPINEYDTGLNFHQILQLCRIGAFQHRAVLRDPSTSSAGLLDFPLV